MRRIHHIALSMLLMALCVGCDQVTKQLAKETLPTRGPLVMLSNTVTLIYAENPGAFLSLGAQLSMRLRFYLLTVGSGGMLVLGVGLLCWGHLPRPWQYYSLACIVGGGIGNLLDRLGNQGYVIDFLLLQLGPLRTGIFNVADAAITTGLVFYGVMQLWSLRTKPPTTAA